MNKAFPISMTVLFFIALFLVSSDMRYARKVYNLAMKNKSLSYTMLHWSIVTHA